MREVHCSVYTNVLLGALCVGLAASSVHTDGALVNEPPYGPHRRSVTVNRQGAAAAACLLAALGVGWMRSEWLAPPVFFLVHVALAPHVTFFHALLAFLLGAFTAETASLAYPARVLVSMAPVALVLWSTGADAQVAPVVAIAFMALTRVLVPLAPEKELATFIPPQYALDAILAGAGLAVRAAH